jgi:hypothetical protein
MGSTLGPNSGPRAGVILTHPNSFPFLSSKYNIYTNRVINKHEFRMALFMDSDFKCWNLIVIRLKTLVAREKSSKLQNTKNRSFSKKKLKKFSHFDFFAPHYPYLRIWR